jgi:Protein kinase domain
MGTPSYMSPEQIRGTPVEARSDLFSFGVMTFQLLTGLLPFNGNSINTILYNIVNEPPVEPPATLPGILPSGWHRVFDHALAKEPKDRHSTCCEFVLDLLRNCVETTEQERQVLFTILDLDVDLPPGTGGYPTLRHLGKTVPRKAGMVGPVLVAGSLMVALAGAVAVYAKKHNLLPLPAPWQGGPVARPEPIARSVPGESDLVGAAATPDRKPPETDAVAPAPQEGSLRITGAFSVRVRSKGRDLGEAGNGRTLPLAAGTHRIELSAPQVFFKETRTVEIQSGQPTALQLPSLVHVKITTHPGTALILVDGLSTGIESLGDQAILVSAGAHTIGFEGKSQRQTFNFQRDETKTIPLE